MNQMNHDESDVAGERLREPLWDAIQDLATAYDKTRPAPEEARESSR